MDKFQQNIKVNHVPMALIVFIVSTILMVLVQLPTPEALNPFGCILGTIAIVSGVWASMCILFSIE